MNTTMQAEKEKALGFEIMRLMHLTRDEPIDNLLDAALAGRAKTVESVTKLYQFVLRSFGEPTGLVPSAVTGKFKEASFSFLREAGLTQQQLEKVYRPWPVAGDKDFISVIDEMREQGLLT